MCGIIAKLVWPKVKQIEPTIYVYQKIYLELCGFVMIGWKVMLTLFVDINCEIKM